MTPSFVVFIDEGRWRVARTTQEHVALREVDASQDAGSAVWEALRELGYVNGGLCLAMPSNLVFAANVDCRQLPPRTPRRAGMLCLLEEQLPLDIESMTADFLPSVGECCLGVAVESPAVQKIVQTLESAGLEVQSICPAATLAVWELCRDGRPSDYALIVWQHRIDVIRLKAGLPIAWYTAGADMHEALECITADQLTNPLEADHVDVSIIGGPGQCDDAVEGKGGIKVTNRIEEPAEQLAARAAGRASAGQTPGWVNLQRDALALARPWAPMRRNLRLAAAMAIVLPLVLAGAFIWRAAQYGVVADDAYQQEAAAWRKLNPGRSVPEALNRRLRSDLTRLRAISGAADETPSRVNALDTMRRVIAALPSGMRLRVLEMRLDPNTVYVEGQALSHADAETITRMQIEAGMEMDPPRTENLSTGGVKFTLNGRPGPTSAEPVAPELAADSPGEPLPATQAGDAQEVPQ